jgi:hypothetical protein
MSQSSIVQTSPLHAAVARYIGERPAQADSSFHLPSFAHCFVDAFTGASEQELVNVFATFVRAGWLIEEPCGYCITPKARYEARRGWMPLSLDLPGDTEPEI